MDPEGGVAHALRRLLLAGRLHPVLASQRSVGLGHLPALGHFPEDELPGHRLSKRLEPPARSFRLIHPNRMNPRP